MAARSANSAYGPPRTAMSTLSKSSGDLSRTTATLQNTLERVSETEIPQQPFPSFQSSRNRSGFFLCESLPAYLSRALMRQSQMSCNAMAVCPLSAAVCESDGRHSPQHSPIPLPRQAQHPPGAHHPQLPPPILNLFTGFPNTNRDQHFLIRFDCGWFI